MTSSVTSTQQLAFGYAPTRDDAKEVALSPHPEDTSTEGSLGHLSLFGEDGFEFSDLIDVVNPLQHLPFVSTMYRENTGDELGAVPRVAGATLFFGPIGLVSSLANVFIEGSTGKDMGEHVADWVLPDDGSEELQTAENNTDGVIDANDGSVDPVSAWARQEVAWAQSRANTWAPPPPETVPDAAPHLRRTDQLAAASAPSAYTDTVMPMRLTEDVRSAAWAYRAAAALGAPSTNAGAV